MSRKTTLETIREHPDVSVLIVGGGINGAGVFRDLAAQGIDVVLIDRADFSSGASAGSSHMVHGGLRYLENGEFRLVREALRERNRLLRNAPHAVRPLPTTVPIFGRFSGLFNAPLKFFRLRDRPAERGALVIKIGLTLYDLFTVRQRATPRHRFLSRQESLALRSQLNPAIRCTAVYYDAFVSRPERLCVELILDGERSSAQARALNYLSLESGSGDRVTLRDELSGETFEVKPRLVVNAAGPWIDVANRKLYHTTRFIGGTKGSHLVLNHPELHRATLGHELFFENQDGRICLCLPLGDKVLVGSTDIPIDDPDAAECTEEEVDYLLDMLRIVFPSIEVDRSHIVFRFTGVRPLPCSDAATPGQISRDHKLEITEAGDGVPFPVYSLVGGKWTTFRAFAEQTADRILTRLGQSRQLSTADVAIGGGRLYPRSEADRVRWLADVQSRTGLAEERLHRLFDRYGTYAESIAQFLAAGEDAPLRYLPEYSRREILYLATREKVAHLDDLLLRRSLIAMLGYVTRDLLEEIAPVVAEGLGWPPDEMHQEIERTVALLRTRHKAAL